MGAAGHLRRRGSTRVELSGLEVPIPTLKETHNKTITIRVPIRAAMVIGTISFAQLYTWNNVRKSPNRLAYLASWYSLYPESLLMQGIEIHIYFIEYFWVPILSNYHYVRLRISHDIKKNLYRHPMKTSFLVVGLGNPGTRYSSTRHNIGFMVVDALAAKHGAQWKRDTPDVEIASIRILATELLIIKPLTFMNLSGIVVAQVARSLGIEPSKIVAVVDEYNFATGRINLRLGGSSGGHNGISSLIENLGSDVFWRLRCGIDRNFGSGELVEYVLAPFPIHEAELLKSMISIAVATIEETAKGGPELARLKLNRA